MSNPSDKSRALQSPWREGGGREGVQLPGALKGKSMPLLSRSAGSSGLSLSTQHSIETRGGLPSRERCRHSGVLPLS